MWQSQTMSIVDHGSSFYLHFRSIYICIQFIMFIMTECSPQIAGITSSVPGFLPNSYQDFQQGLQCLQVIHWYFQGNEGTEMPIVKPLSTTGTFYPCTSMVLPLPLLGEVPLVFWSCHELKT